MKPRVTLPTPFLIFLCLVIAGLSSAQEGDAPQASAEDGGSNPSQLFFESVDVEVVNVEVTVKDRAGEPVTGLTRDDFEILEDGQLVPVSNFFAVEGRQAVGEDGSPDLSTQPETRSLFLVVYIDHLNLRPENRNRTFGQLRQFLFERLDPRDRVMVVSFDGRLEVLQNFTADMTAVDQALGRLEKETGKASFLQRERDNLLRQIARVPLHRRPAAAGGAVDVGEFDYAQSAARRLVGNIDFYVQNTYKNIDLTVQGIERFSDSLSGLPGRKAILYLSDGIPSRPGAALVQAWRNRFELWASRNDAQEVLQEIPRLLNVARDATPLFRRLVNHSSSHRVSFYPLSNNLRDGIGASSAEFFGAGTDNGNGSFSRDVLTIDAFSRESSLLAMAEGTGGTAFTRSSNLDGLLDRMSEDFATFYSLGYTPPNRESDKFHKLEVRVKDRPDLRVSHVKGYRQLDPIRKMENLTLSALYFDFQDNPLDVQLSTGQHNETAGGFFRVPLLIKVPFQNLALLPNGEEFAGQVLAFVVVQDERGDISPFQRIALPIRIPSNRFQEALQADAGYQVDLVMRKGKNRISVGVRDHIADLETTVNLDVSVGLGRDSESSEATTPGAEVTGSGAE